MERDYIYDLSYTDQKEPAEIGLFKSFEKAEHYLREHMGYKGGQPEIHFEGHLFIYGDYVIEKRRVF